MPFSQSRLAFDPARDGFSFPNSFEWTEPDLEALGTVLRPVTHVLASLLPAAGGAVTGGRRGLLGGAVAGMGLAGLGVGDGLMRAGAACWPRFGLCGGMALAAAERWPLRAGLPTADLQAEHVRRLLWRRQIATLRASGSMFVRHWLAARAGRPVAPTDLLREWDAIRARIDAGRPVVVGLVGDAPDPFAQHQVLAYGYAGTEERGTLYVYDPNRPGEEHTLAFTTTGDRARITTGLPTGPSDGGYLISTRAGEIDRLFVVAV
jgi:hypothetical protein